MLGDSSKAHEKLNSSPEITLEEIIDEMIEFDKKEAKKELILKQSGMNNISVFEFHLHIRSYSDF